MKRIIYDFLDNLPARDKLMLIIGKDCSCVLRMRTLCFKNANDIQKGNWTYLPMTAVSVLSSELQKIREFPFELIFTFVF